MNEKITVLLVDDEEAIIRSYKRFFAVCDEPWDFEYAYSAEEALKILEEKKIEVLVTDVRMPGMSGLELLEIAMSKYPDMCRIVISGQFDEKVLVNSLNLVEQYLFKPCDPENIRKEISKALDIRQDLTKSRLDEILGDMDSLPTLPSVYKEITDKLKDTNSSMKEIGQIISHDISMTAKVLHLVNSSFFGLRRKISAPEEAVVFIGIETVKAMVLSLHVFSQVEVTDLPKDYLENLWEHSFICANYARLIAMSLDKDKKFVETVFTAAIIHDLGRIILIQNKLGKYLEYLNALKSGEKDSLETERKYFNTDHSEIGAFLVRMWGLPNCLIDPILCHHKFPLEKATEIDENFLVYTANYLSHKVKPMTGCMHKMIADVRVFEKTGTVNLVPEWEMLCKKCSV